MIKCTRFTFLCVEFTSYECSTRIDSNKIMIGIAWAIMLISAINKIRVCNKKFTSILCKEKSVDLYLFAACDIKYFAHNCQIK